MRMIIPALVFLLPVTASAADPAAPVREVMAAVEANWKSADDGQKPEDVDYFSDDFLARLYSRDFTTNYRAAQKYPAFDEGTTPFEYDVIIMGQDGCDLKDVAITPGPTTAGRTDVTVTFDNTHCFGEREPGWKPNEVHFQVIEEAGKPVIDDIIRTLDGPQSLKDEMKEIVRVGAGGTPQGILPQDAE